VAEKVRGFFFEQQDISLKEAELAFKKSVAFIPPNSKKYPNKDAWIKHVGTYYYYALTLSNFNPVEAERIFDQPAHIIAYAVVSQMAYNYYEPKK
jgi:hypothetical protein